MSKSPLKVIKTMTKYVSTTDISPGQFLFCVDTKRCFYDTSTNTRLEIDFYYDINAENTTELSNWVNNRVYYLEAIDKFYVYKSVQFKLLTTIEEVDNIFGVYGLVPFTLENPGTGTKLAPRTLASAVYTSNGENLEDLLVKGYRVGTTTTTRIIVDPYTEYIEIPFPFDDYLLLGNTMEVFYNGLRLNFNSDYTIDSVQLSDSNSISVITFIDITNINTGDIVTFVFTYNTETVLSDERRQTVIDGGYIANSSIPTKKLAKITNNPAISSSEYVPTSKAINEMYQNLMGIFNNTVTTTYQTTVIAPAASNKICLKTESYTISSDNQAQITISYPYPEFIGIEGNNIIVFYNGILLLEDEDYAIDGNKIYIINDDVSMHKDDVINVFFIGSANKAYNTIRSSTKSVIIYTENEHSVKIPVPFSGYFDNPKNIMTVFYNGFRLNYNEDYTISDNRINIITNFDTHKNDIITYIFLYDTQNLSTIGYSTSIIELDEEVTTINLILPKDGILDKDTTSILLYCNGVRLAENHDYTIDTLEHTITFDNPSTSGDILTIVFIYYNDASTILTSDSIVTIQTNGDHSITIPYPFENYSEIEGNSFIVYYNGMYLAKDIDYTISNDTIIINNSIDTLNDDIINFFFIYNNYDDTIRTYVYNTTIDTDGNSKVNITKPYNEYFDNPYNIARIYYNGIILDPKYDYSVINNGKQIRITDSYETEAEDQISIVYIYDTNEESKINSSFVSKSLELSENEVEIPFPIDNYFESNLGNSMEVFYNGLRLNKGIDYTIKTRIEDGNTIFLISIIDEYEIQEDDILSFSFIYNNPPTEEALVDKTVISRTRYAGISIGDADTVTLINEDAILEDGTEFDVQLNINLNNNATFKLNTFEPLPIILNDLRTTSCYKAGDILTLVYNKDENVYKVKLYSDYKINNYTYYIAVTEDTTAVIEFDIPKFVEGITPLRVYQNNLRLFDTINYTVKDNTIHLLDYTAKRGDYFYFEIDTVERYCL